MLPIYITTVHASTLCSAKNGLASYNSIWCAMLAHEYHYRRALSDSEKKCYIEAIKCLQSRPAHNDSRPASWTRFDEFQGTHIELAFNIHYVVNNSFNCLT